MDDVYNEQEAIKEWLHGNDPYYTFYPVDERTEQMVNWKYEDLTKLREKQEELEQQFKELDRTEYFQFMAEFEQRKRMWL